VNLSPEWRCTPVIPALGKLRLEDQEFKASPDYIARPYLKNKNKTKKGCPGTSGLMPVILDTWEAEIRRIVL
jgi:hypothetical protein